MKKQLGKPKTSAKNNDNMGLKKKSTLHPSDNKAKNKRYLDEYDEDFEDNFDAAYSDKFSLDDFDDDDDDDDY